MGPAEVSPVSDSTPDVPVSEDSPAAEGAPVAEAPRVRASLAPPSVLSRPTDAAARPGFRSPPNAASKAQKKNKKKR